MLQNEYLVAKIGVDSEKNGPLQVWGGDSIQYLFHSLVAMLQMNPFFFACLGVKRKEEAERSDSGKDADKEREAA